MNFDDFQQFKVSAKDQQLLKKIDSKTLSIAVKTCTRILAEWGLNSDKLSVVLNYRDDQDLNEKLASVDYDLSFRASLVLGIYADLRTIFIQQKHRLEWLYNRNRSLDEKSPADCLCTGDDYLITKVRVLLTRASS